MLRQTLGIMAMNLRSVLSRKGSSSIIVVGIAGVVAVVVGLLSMSEGIASALQETSHPDRVLVIRSGTRDEITGWLSTAEVNARHLQLGWGSGDRSGSPRQSEQTSLKTSSVTPIVTSK